MYDNKFIPRVSYILTSFNRAGFLKTALQNIREYITGSDELIIVDGGSTDSTGELVRVNNDIVSTFISEPDIGEAHAYNKGLLISKGKYIKFLTDDDYFYPEAMRKSIIALEGHPEFDALQCGGEHFCYDSQSGKLKFCGFSWLSPEIRLKESVSNLFLRSNNIVCGAGLWLTKGAVSKIGLFDTSYVCIDASYLAKLVAHPNVNIKFFSIKLYRHNYYLHSGAMNLSFVQRDGVRVLLVHKCWSNIFSGAYPDRAIIEALGLSGWRQFLSLAASFFRYRISRFALARAVARVMRALLPRFYNFLYSLKDKCFHYREIRPVKTQPVWDESLR